MAYFFVVRGLKGFGDILNDEAPPSR